MKITPLQKAHEIAFKYAKSVRGLAEHEAIKIHDIRFNPDVPYSVTPKLREEASRLVHIYQRPAKEFGIGMKTVIKPIPLREAHPILKSVRRHLQKDKTDRQAVRAAFGVMPGRLVDGMNSGPAPRLVRHNGDINILHYRGARDEQGLVDPIGKNDARWQDASPERKMRLQVARGETAISTSTSRREAKVRLYGHGARPVEGVYATPLQQLIKNHREKSTQALVNNTYPQEREITQINGDNLIGVRKHRLVQHPSAPTDLLALRVRTPAGPAKEFAGMLPDGYHLPAVDYDGESYPLGNYGHPEKVREKYQETAEQHPSRSVDLVYEKQASLVGGKSKKLTESRIRNGGIITVANQGALGSVATDSQGLHPGQPEHGVLVRKIQRGVRRHEIAHSILQQRRGGVPDTVAAMGREEIAAHAKQFFGKASPHRDLPLMDRLRRAGRGVVRSTRYGIEQFKIKKWFEDHRETALTHPTLGMALKNFQLPHDYATQPDSSERREFIKTGILGAGLAAGAGIGAGSDWFISRYNSANQIH